MMSELWGREGVQESRTLVMRVSTQNSDMGEGVQKQAENSDIINGWSQTWIMLVNKKLFIYLASTPQEIHNHSLGNSNLFPKKKKIK